MRKIAYASAARYRSRLDCPGFGEDLNDIPDQDDEVDQAELRGCRRPYMWFPYVLLLQLFVAAITALTSGLDQAGTCQALCMLLISIIHLGATLPSHQSICIANLLTVWQAGCFVTLSVLCVSLLGSRSVRHPVEALMVLTYSGPLPRQ